MKSFQEYKGDRKINEKHKLKKNPQRAQERERDREAGITSQKQNI
jgi:hypothetical protein